MMTNPETPGDPIRKTVTVPLDRQAAFDLFTAGIDRWWPKESHSLAARTGGASKVRVHVEPREGGRVVETMPDGSEAPWAEVTAWDPGARFGMRWFVGRSPDEATLVDIRFTAVDAGTRIDLTHSGFSVLGKEAREVCANYTRGWDHVLVERFGNICMTAA